MMVHEIIVRIVTSSAFSLPHLSCLQWSIVTQKSVISKQGGPGWEDMWQRCQVYVVCVMTLGSFLYRSYHFTWWFSLSKSCCWQQSPMNVRTLHSSLPGIRMFVHYLGAFAEVYVLWKVSSCDERRWALLIQQRNCAYVTAQSQTHEISHLYSTTCDLQAQGTDESGTAGLNVESENTCLVNVWWNIKHCFCRTFERGEKWGRLFVGV